MADPGLMAVWPDLDNKQRTALWFRLPLTLRKKYWNETTYGRDPPSEQLVQELQQARKDVVKYCT